MSRTEHFSDGSTEQTPLQLEIEALQEIYSSAVVSHPLPRVLLLSIAPLLVEHTPIRLVLPNNDSLPHTIPVLPPVRLKLLFSPDYPDERPKLHITCDYASLERLKELAVLLEELFEMGEVIVFEWMNAVAEFVEERVLERVDEEYILRLVDDDEMGEVDVRVARDRVRGSSAALEVQRYARTEMGQRVRKGWWKCPSCWETIDGEKCMGLMSCGHVGCRECWKGFWEARISEGKVMERDLGCLKEGCRGGATGDEVRNVVDGEMFERFERLTLERALERQGGGRRCLRVGCEEVMWVEGKLGRCGKCGYAVCLMCEKAWHGGGYCKGMNMEELVQLIEEGEGETVEKKREEAQEMGYTEIWERVELAISLNKQGARVCPQCQVAVVKSWGCNFMRCACGCTFCWKCLTVFEDGWVGDHFQTGRCHLYDTDGVSKIQEQVWEAVFGDVE